MKLTDYIFNGIRVPSYKKYLDLAAFRHKLISGNLANLSTPGYQSRDIQFSEEYNKANGTNRPVQLTKVTTHSAHIPIGRSQISSPNVREAKVVDGMMNSVELDKEISNMTQNELLFTVGARLLQKKFEGLRNAITSK